MIKHRTRWERTRFVSRLQSSLVYNWVFQDHDLVRIANISLLYTRFFVNKNHFGGEEYWSSIQRTLLMWQSLAARRSQWKHKWSLYPISIFFGLLLRRLTHHKLYAGRFKPQRLQLSSTMRNICWPYCCHYHLLRLTSSILNTSKLSHFGKHFNRSQHFSKYCKNVHPF
jgi:hypothetical protein